MPTNCLFCQIIAGQIPATVVHRTERLTAIRDINPAAPTHLLLLPNEHIGSVAEAQPAHAALLGELLLTAAVVAQQQGLGGGYRLVINTGADGGQTVQHLHVHLLGGRAMRWPPG
ncbi:MAG: histidine triad nucleotide-binding protein [Anaerolineales bacterium]|nr:histidine triad nucleotide-binding protein [Anaerolineales bacterium]